MKPASANIRYESENSVELAEYENAYSLSSSILKSVLYYDLFNYPLTPAEIRKHCAEPDCTTENIQAALEKLQEQGLLFSFGMLYSVQNNPDVFARRIKGNQSAAEVMSKVKQRSRLIASFPFVRCVCISGSLSKNYFDETTDADFFVITEPNRLWICRTLLVLYKKIFLFNSKKYFCVNYFIDAESLLIPDKNIFTATELITLKPMYHQPMYERLIAENSWVKTIFPNNILQRTQALQPEPEPWLKRTCEKLMAGNAGEWLDQFFMNQTLRSWKKRFGWQPPREFEVNMRTRRNVSKHHPQGFQFQVLKRYDERVKSFEERHQITLN